MTGTDPPATGLFGDDAPASARPAPSALDRALLDAYLAQRRSLDDLPFTPAADAICQAVGAPGPPAEQTAVLHRLLNLRKAGKLPALGADALPSTAPLRLDPEHERALVIHVQQAVGKVSARDRLAGAPEFVDLTDRFNAETGLTLSPHDLWRVVAKLGKRSGGPAPMQAPSHGSSETHEAPATPSKAPVQPADVPVEAVEVPRPEPIAQADLRVGVIRTAKVNPKARNPSMVLEIDLGPLGVLTSSSQITNLYRPEDLPGRTVIVAAGLGARRVGGVKSHVLTLGVPTPDGITLLTADPGAKPGDPVF